LATAASQSGWAHSTLTLPGAATVAHSALASYAGKTVVAGLRPEHLPAAHAGFSGPVLAGDVDLVEALGSELVIHFTIDAKRVVAEGAHAADAEAATISGEGVARVDPRTPAKAGERVSFAVDVDGIQFFDPDSGAAIWT
jgi:multiple sugar transport system ATP-binding protein